MSAPFAHFGHWWTSILYLAPVAVVIVWLGFQSWRAKRQDRENS
jgi:threonine/homoserine/homoserine lactone efflux protein